MSEPGSTTEQLKAISPSLTDVLARLHALAEVQTKIAEQQTVILTKMGEVITQINKHSLFLVNHERAIARCLSCQNYHPSDALDDTRVLAPHPVVYPPTVNESKR